MKKLILTAGAAFMMCAAFAQAPQQAAPQPGAPMQAPKPMNPEQQAERQAEGMAKNLQLSADQQAKVKAVFLEQRTKIEAARKDNAADPSKRGEAMRSARDEADKKLQGILTADQWKKYQETMQHHGPMKPMQPAPAAAPKQ